MNSVEPRPDPEPAGSASPLAAPEPAGARYSQTVPRHLVHRSAVSEVLVTGWRVDSPQRCEVDVQWPRGHGFYPPVAGRWFDPVLGLESVRQASMVAALQCFGAPSDTTFLVRELSFAADPEGLVVGRQPAELFAAVTARDVVMRGPHLRRMGTVVRLSQAGAPVAVGATRFSCLAPLAYERLRATTRPEAPDAALPAPLDPAVVGRYRPEDVVLAPGATPHDWLLRVDRRHPTLFDHPLDHIPGMAVVEAVRQAAHVLCQARVVLPLDLAVTYHSFIELGVDCQVRGAIVGRPAGDVAATVEFTQTGRLVAEATVLARPVG